ncbi:MAG: sigma-70 family RNA polymerase sigma factor [Myxococcales bacterium]|nr:sigma-70 family RNA polymerase sigma factor [Myxococcales bacterium]
MSRGNQIRVGEDWSALLERLLEGDRLAFARFNRLVSGFLVQLRAYDFQDEWDDLRQEVLMATLANARANRLRDAKAFVGYVRIITRNKFMDRLKRSLRSHERENLPWDDESARAAAEADEGFAPLGAPIGAPLGEAWAAVRELPEADQRLLTGLYVEGRTYQEMCQEAGVPLGSLKRRLTKTLRTLRERLQAAEEGDP